MLYTKRMEQKSLLEMSDTELERELGSADGTIRVFPESLRVAFRAVAEETREKCTAIIVRGFEFNDSVIPVSIVSDACVALIRALGTTEPKP